MSGTLPNLSFEIYGFLPFGSGLGDSNPSDVLYDLLTNAVYGCGIDASQIGSMTQYSNYCVANGLLISPAIDSVRTAADWIKDILDATNSEIIETGGQLVVLPYGDTTVVANGVTFTPATQPIYDLTNDDFIRSGQQPSVSVERPTIQDAYNAVTVEYLDRGNSYNPTIVQAQDLQAIDSYKYRPEGTRQYHMFTGQTAAAKCAATALARLVYIRNKFKFKLPQKYILLDPMDIVTITVAELGLSQSPVRILTIDEQPDRTLDITAEEFPWGCSGPTLYPKQSQVPGGPNAYAPPGSINTPIMFEALSRLNNQIGHTIWFGTSGANPNWGGCRIWVSLDGDHLSAGIDSHRAQHYGSARLRIILRRLTLTIRIRCRLTSPNLSARFQRSQPPSAIPGPRSASYRAGLALPMTTRALQCSLPAAATRTRGRHSRADGLRIVPACTFPANGNGPCGSRSVGAPRQELPSHRPGRLASSLRTRTPLSAGRTSTVLQIYAEGLTIRPLRHILRAAISCS